jgi:DNA-binding NarL/FixJ family response regulator
MGKKGIAMVYRIVVGSELGERYASAFEGMLMERRDGLKLMRPLREANPQARVFVMSATVEMSHPEDALEAGADGVIDKLDAPERVFALIRGEGGG